MLSEKKKLDYLREMTEDDFRHRLATPLFVRQGFKHLYENCGPTEEGKDSIFSFDDPFGHRQVYAVQTKRGDVKLSSTASSNLTNIVAQLRTAAETCISLADKSSVRPDKVLLCTSGKITDGARRHIADTLQETRLKFIDSSEIVQWTDKFYPEFWLGVDAQKLPYLKSLASRIEDSEGLLLPAKSDTDKSISVFSGGFFIPLYLHRYDIEFFKEKGEVKQQLRFEQISANRLLQENAKLILVGGENGTGKSVCLKKLALEICRDTLDDPKARVTPLVMAAKNFKEQKFDARSAIQAASEYAMASSSPVDDKNLHEGTALFIVDAFDELSSQERREELIAEIVACHARFPKCRFICAARPYSSLFAKFVTSGFTRYDVSDIDLEQAENAIESLSSSRSMASEGAKETLRQLQDVHGVKLSPMIVTLFVGSSDLSRKDVPPNIAEIFKKYTEHMLGRWDESKGLSQQFEYKIKDFLLKKIASKLHLERQSRIEVDDCKNFIEETMRNRSASVDTDSIYDEAVVRSGLFRIENKQISFRHHVLQEFFAGRDLRDASEIGERLSDSWWRTPIVFYFGERGEDSDGLDQLLPVANSLSQQERFEAAITIGLANQASYLAPSQSTREHLRWVVHTLSDSFRSTADNPDWLPFSIGPLHRFLHYYLSGRDAVACNQLPDVNLDRPDSSSNHREPANLGDGCYSLEDLDAFWRIAGLIDIGNIGAATSSLDSFAYKDRRLPLALHLGCFITENLKYTDPDTKRLAKQTADQLGPEVRSLIREVHEEFKGYLLQLSGGRVRAIPRRRKKVKSQSSRKRSRRGG